MNIGEEKWFENVFKLLSIEKQIELISYAEALLQSLQEVKGALEEVG